MPRVVPGMALVVGRLQRGVDTKGAGGHTGRGIMPRVVPGMALVVGRCCAAITACTSVSFSLFRKAATKELLPALAAPMAYTGRPRLSRSTAPTAASMPAPVRDDT
eukprot:3373858-Pyramimonas_sp.AAC.1